MIKIAGIAFPETTFTIIDVQAIWFNEIIGYIDVWPTIVIKIINGSTQAIGIMCK